MSASEFTTLLQRAERVLAQLEAFLPPATPAPNAPPASRDEGRA